MGHTARLPLYVDVKPSMTPGTLPNAPESRCRGGRRASGRWRRGLPATPGSVGHLAIEPGTVLIQLPGFRDTFGIHVAGGDTAPGEIKDDLQ